MNEPVDVAVEEEAAGQVVTVINRNSKPYTDCRLVCVCVSIERARKKCRRAVCCIDQTLYQPAPANKHDNQNAKEKRAF